MIEIITYLIVSYVLVFAFAALISKKLCTSHSLSKRRKQFLGLFFILILACPLIPYGLIETQTFLFGTKLINSTKMGLRAEGMDGQILTLKVLSINVNIAKVYVIVKRQSLLPTTFLSGDSKLEPCVSAHIFELRRNAEKWRYSTDLRDVWSDCGSANGNIFPPYLGKGEYHY